MNIFILDKNLERCARYHCDKHVVKMVTEYAQILCSAKHLCGETAPYRLTHKGHPCVKWASESLTNWIYLKELGSCLYGEYQHRYGDKIHKAGEVILELPVPKKMQDKGLTPFALAMPDEYKTDDPVESYRAYYVGEKTGMLHYRNRQAPSWISEARLYSELSGEPLKKSKLVEVYHG